MLNRVLVRWSAPLLVALVALLGACPRTATLSGAEDDDLPPVDPGSVSSYCGSDEDCLAVGPSCCECPTFALSHNDPLAQACEDIPCDGMAMCPDNLVPKCLLDVNKCDLRCKEIACNASCEGGFQADGNGCLTCSCAVATATSCLGDGDCVRVRADCCGCALGGFDTAVPKTEQTQHEAGLMCPPSSSCPGVDTCASYGAPRCVQNKCTLLDPGPLPPDACGRNDLRPCDPGFECVLNANDSATLHGVGVCVAKPE